MSNLQAEYELYVEYALQKWLVEEKGYSEYDAKLFGAVAHLGERIPCTDEVAGSNPVSSTNASIV